MSAMKNSITIGDKVDVLWEHLEPIFNAEVMHVAQATGDCWILKVNESHIPSDTIIYVQTFARMKKL